MVRQREKKNVEDQENREKRCLVGWHLIEFETKKVCLYCRLNFRRTQKEKSHPPINAIRP